MKLILFFFILSAAALTSCKKEEKTITLADDKIHGEIKKEISSLEGDIEVLQSRNTNLEKKINDLTSNHKFIELLKKQKFQNLRHIDLAEQNIALLKIKFHEREKFLSENQSQLKAEDLDQNYQDYLTNKSVNPASYPWRRGLAPLENPATVTSTPAADGHGAAAEHGTPAEKAPNGEHH